MSYCRFSSDDFQCDLYVYADVAGGFTIHTAARRYKEGCGYEPIPAACFKDGVYQFGKDAEADRLMQEHHKKQEEAMEDMALPHAGETFRLGSAEETIAKMMELRALGYRFPDYAVEALQKEDE